MAQDGNILMLTDPEEFRATLATTNLLIVYCYASWCGPCKFIAPFFAGLSVNPAYAHVQFVKINVEEAAEIAEHLEVTAMPTFYFYKDGKLLDKFSGASCDDLCIALDKLIAST
jgi:thioredoxin 1